MNEWSVLNLALIVLSVWTGYGEMAPDRLAHSNPDVVFCTITRVGMIAFSLGAVWYSVSGAHQEMLHRPSWRRFSIDWWHDPSQCLFLTCSFMGGMAVGAALRLPGTSQAGFWMFMFFVCMFVGLLIGQFAVYAVYRERIAKTSQIDGANRRPLCIFAFRRQDPFTAIHARSQRRSLISVYLVLWHVAHCSQDR